MPKTSEERRVVVTQPTAAPPNVIPIRGFRTAGTSYPISESATAYGSAPVSESVQATDYVTADMARLAERIMLDSTVLVAKLDTLSGESGGAPPATIFETDRGSPTRVVSVDSVIRGGAAIVGCVSALALLGYFMSGVIIIQPFISLILFVASMGFAGMSLVKPE